MTVAKPVKAPPVISEDVTPDRVYAMREPAETLDVVIVKNADESSFTGDLMAETTYVGVFDVSLTIVDTVTPPAVTVRVSDPSVSESFKSTTEIVAIPLELTTALPLSEPPDTSAALIPDRVYGTDVPDATFVVVSVNVAVEPSLIEGLDDNNR